MNDFRFRPNERLKRRKLISQLFQPGSRTLMQYPFRLVWLPVAEPEDGAALVQVTVSVSKRRFKRAVQRNRIKRLVREAYRLHKHELYEALPEDQPPMAWMLIFVGKEMPTYRQVEKGMTKLIRKFIRNAVGTPTNE